MTLGFVSMYVGYYGDLVIDDQEPNFSAVDVLQGSVLTFHTRWFDLNTADVLRSYFKGCDFCNSAIF